MCWFSWNLGASTYWNPQGLSRPVMGLLFLYMQVLSGSMPTFPHIQWILCSFPTLTTHLHLAPKLRGSKPRNLYFPFCAPQGAEGHTVTRLKCRLRYNNRDTNSEPENMSSIIHYGGETEMLSSMSETQKALICWFLAKRNLFWRRSDSFGLSMAEKATRRTWFLVKSFSYYRKLRKSLDFWQVAAFLLAWQDAK